MKSSKLLKCALFIFLFVNNAFPHQYTKQKPLVVVAFQPGTNLGLGNQFFFYAAAYNLAKRVNGKLVFLDVYSQDKDFNDSTKRNFGLDNFNIDSKDKLPADWLHKNPQFLRVTEQNYFDIKAGEASVYVLGDDKTSFFESEIFFKESKDHISSVLKYNFNFNEDSPLKETLSDIWDSESVAIHIRRGDFQTRPGIVLAFSYYEEAIETMKAKLKNPVFYVFSDDVDFINEKFQNRANFVIVSKKGNSSIEEFYLMANCKHMIVANSTFSWWAAYLNRNANKIIIRPSPKYAKSWVQNFQLSARMIHQNFPYPDEWIKVDSGLR